MHTEPVRGVKSSLFGYDEYEEKNLKRLLSIETHESVWK